MRYGGGQRLPTIVSFGCIFSSARFVVIYRRGTVVLEDDVDHRGVEVAMSVEWTVGKRASIHYRITGVFVVQRCQRREMACTTGGREAVGVGGVPPVWRRRKTQRTCGIFGPS